MTPDGRFVPNRDLFPAPQIELQKPSVITYIVVITDAAPQIELQKPDGRVGWPFRPHAMFETQHTEPVSRVK
jgi:hypothetical protein